MNAYKILVGKPKGKRLLGTLTHRWMNNPEIELQNIRWVDIGDMARDRDQEKPL
jgi:hypothetical protein